MTLEDHTSNFVRWNTAGVVRWIEEGREVFGERLWSCYVRIETELEFLKLEHFFFQKEYRESIRRIHLIFFIRFEISKVWSRLLKTFCTSTRAYLFGVSTGCVGEYDFE